MKTMLCNILFDRLGHQKSADFPFKNRRKSCLHTKHICWCFKPQKISTSHSTWSPNGGPKICQKIMKIQLGTFQGPSECICDPLDCKLVPKWCPRTSEWNQNGHPRTLKRDKNQQNPITNDVTKKFIF